MRKKQILTEEERYLREIENGLYFVKRCLPFLPDPTYRFEVGQKVRYGAIRNPVVKEVLFDGKAYILEYQDRQDILVTKWAVVSWLYVRPVLTEKNSSSFTNDKKIKLNFYNMSIESLLHRSYNIGVNMNPEYQRDYVWDMDDKIALLDSVFAGLDIGKFVFVEKDYRPYGCEILDGKQRLSTLMEFYENRWAYNGKCYNDLSAKDQYAIRDHLVSVADVNAEKQDVLKCFLALNQHGRSMTREELKHAEGLYHSI